MCRYSGKASELPPVCGPFQISSSIESFDVIDERMTPCPGFTRPIPHAEVLTLNPPQNLSGSVSSAFGAAKNRMSGSVSQQVIIIMHL